ncbi:hypothetical protein PENTCL1PPCAC_1470 [Pristionchus entomophagus]|uniref:G protein-coupled receptor n=1 Tax=Pristionchus entomophagus TaxID=358040 RepID=A0AAV5S9H3_9BILA|nr:hypothetical protein PENTCL1PPCAC_1470 [Pristionchus entomophagus]
MFFLARSFSLSGTLFPQGSAYSAIMDRRDHTGRQNLCGVHVQTALYTTSIVAIIISLAAIALGILLTLHSDWHEFLPLYKQHLAYLRRANPQEYWLIYKIVAISWTVTHFIHGITVGMTIAGAVSTRPRLLIPQFLMLILLTGVYIFSFSALLILTFTRPRHLFFSVSFIIIFAFFACANLVVLVVFFRFLSDKAEALREILANTKSVHFKESTNS